MATSVPFYRRDIQHSFDYGISAWTVPTESVPHIGVMCHEFHNEDIAFFFFITVVRDDTAMEVRLIDGSGFGFDMGSDMEFNWCQTVQSLDNYEVLESVAALYPDHSIAVVEAAALAWPPATRDEVTAIVDDMYTSSADINDLIRRFDAKVGRNNKTKKV
jgi:hypothetical protein